MRFSLHWMPRPFRPRLTAVGLAVLLLLVACTSNQGADTEAEDSLNTLTQAEQGAGWTLLFDGVRVLREASASVSAPWFEVQATGRRRIASPTAARLSRRGRGISGRKLRMGGTKGGEGRR